MSISIPRRRGMAHGDLCSAFVLSCWRIKSGEMSLKQAKAWREQAAKTLHSLEFNEGDPAAIARQQRIDADRMTAARAATVNNPEWHERANAEFEEARRHPQRISWPRPPSKPGLW